MVAPVGSSSPLTAAASARHRVAGRTAELAALAGRLRDPTARAGLLVLISAGESSAL